MFDGAFKRHTSFIANFGSFHFLRVCGTVDT